jgi:hypothetical protein
MIDSVCMNEKCMQYQMLVALTPFLNEYRSEIMFWRGTMDGGHGRRSTQCHRTNSSGRSSKRTNGGVRLCWW